MSTTTEATGQEQYLTFSLADEMYAVEILKVREILEYQPVTVVPRMPRSASAMVNSPLPSEVHSGDGLL